MLDLNHQIQLAEKLADASAEVIRRYFRQPNIAAETKTGDRSSIVTVADREAEEMMVQILQTETADDGIIREEGENIPSRSGYYWVLDPIDGTSSFVKGLPIFGTLIGLVEENSHQSLLGIVNQPILQERWLGVRGQPTRLNGQIVTNPYAQDTKSLLSEACLTSTTPLMFFTQRQQAIAQKLQTLCQRTAFGGDCYNYVSLASGWSAMPIVVLESDLKYYDFCALIPIIEGSNGIITDWGGQPLNAQSHEVLAASNASLHQQVLEAIALCKTFNR